MLIGQGTCIDCIDLIQLVTLSIIKRVDLFKLACNSPWIAQLLLLLLFYFWLKQRRQD